MNSPKFTCKILHISTAQSREDVLRGAFLNKADLREADLRGADLRGARGWTEEQQRAALKSLEGATTPNGQKYEDWLESRDREEDGENSGPS